MRTRTLNYGLKLRAFSRSYFKIVATSLLLLFYAFEQSPLFITYEVNLAKQPLEFFWKNSKGERYGNFEQLKKELDQQGRKLLFATNGGMYQKDGSPLGLYIEHFKTLHPLNTRSSEYGNFYMQPNGVFYIKNQKAYICTTPNFKTDAAVEYATQSGPMLLIDGEIHQQFNPESQHVHIRNGVGVMEDGSVLFVMSKEKVTFHQMAQFFASKGCKNALYLDGFVSRTYLPEKDWVQTDGNFGVLIGTATKP